MSLRKVRRDAYRRLQALGVPTHLLLPPSARRRLAESDLRQAAREALVVNDVDRAKNLLRRATSAYGSQAASWVMYARVLQRLGDLDGSKRAARLALSRDPGNSEAADLLVMQAMRAGREEEAAAVVVSLAEALRRAPGRLDEALPLLIGQGRLDAAEAVAATSGAPLSAREIVRLHVVKRDRPQDLDATVADVERRLSSQEAADVLGRFWLQAGSVDSAIEYLGRLTRDSIPIGLVTREAKRQSDGGRQVAARSLTNLLVRVAPDSPRVKGLGADYRNDYVLLKRGFPFEGKRETIAYSPEARRVFYLLHNSLPHASAGYATRTHGLLTGLHRLDWDMVGVTRLGYPYDMWPVDDEREVPLSDSVDGVTYLRLLGEQRIVRKKPLYDYVHAYADRLEPLLKEQRPAIVHAASNHWNGITAGIAAGRLGIPSVYEVRGLWEVTRGSRDPAYVGTGMYQLAALLETQAALRADKVIAITGALRDEMVARGVPEERIVLVPNGVDTARFAPRPRDRALEEKLGVAGKTVIGYVGSTLDYEGLELLIMAAAKLKAERDDFHVLIVGDGAEWQTFVDLSDRLAVSDVVTFTGRVPHEEVESYYSLIDIAPFPRLPLPVCEMVSPLKPFEAMAMGKAVVVSSVAALTEIVKDGTTGLIFTKGNAEAFADVLRRLLDDPAQMRRLSENGLDWVRRERDWQTLVRRIGDVYEEILA